MAKDCVVIFGASLGGKRAFKKLRKEYDVQLFVDNDAGKQGASLLGKPVKAPAVLSEIPYDKVFIASMYSAEIIYQLREEFGVPPEKIGMLPTEVLDGDDEVPWGCLTVIVGMFVLVGWGIYSLFA